MGTAEAWAGDRGSAFGAKEPGLGLNSPLDSLLKPLPLQLQLHLHQLAQLPLHTADSLGRLVPSLPLRLLNDAKNKAGALARGIRANLALQSPAPLLPLVRHVSRAQAELAGHVSRTHAKLTDHVSQALEPLRQKVQARAGEHTREWRRHQVGRSAEFWGRAFAIYGSYKVCQARAGIAKSKEEQSRIWDSQHEAAADGLYRLCVELGGFFLKAGQFFAKPDIAPDAWVRQLSKLHDSVPPEPFAAIRKVIEGELGGRRLEDVFEWVEEQPLGSASIAQVHKGRLKEPGPGQGQGPRCVAVKVQRAGVEPLMLMDLANLKHFAAFLQKFELPIDLLSIVRELEDQVRLEFDFQLEATAMERIGQSLRTGGRSRRPPAAPPARARGADLSPKSGRSLKGLEKNREGAAPQGQDESPIVVPRSIPGLVSKNMLVMEYVEGVQILRMPEAARKRGIDPNGPIARRAKAKILRDLIEAYGQMMLRDGEFQADPHPGNILILPGPKVALLDYGQTKEFSPELKRNVARLVLAAASRDPVQIGRAMEAAGFETSKTPQEDPHSFLRMGVIMWDTKSSPGLTSSNPFSEESTLKSNSLNTFPKDLFFALKVMQMLRGLAVGMDVNISAAQMWRPLAQQVLKESSGHRV